MNISNGKVVTLTYRLKNDAGEMLDEADASSPFDYIHGGEQVVPGLEAALEGQKAGDKKKVTIEPEMAYGEIQDDLRMEVPRNKFPDNGSDLEAGMQFETGTPNGERMVFTVISVQKDSVNIDGNHPLAGQRLHFDLEVVSVREATKEELSHGHVHGPGGHHHH